MKCSNCSYFKQRGDKGFGSCHLNPPTIDTVYQKLLMIKEGESDESSPLENIALWVHPLVYNNEFCSHYKNKNTLTA